MFFLGWSVIFSAGIQFDDKRPRRFMQRQADVLPSYRQISFSILFRFCSALTLNLQTGAIMKKLSFFRLIFALALAAVNFIHTPAQEITKTSQNLSSFASLSEAVANIGGKPATLLIDENRNVSNAARVPPNIVLKFVNGARLTKTGAGAIVFEGTGVEAAAEQTLFAGFAAGDVRWTNVYPAQISVKWFNARGDGTSDDIAAFDSTVEAMQANPNGEAGIYARLGTNIIIPNSPKPYYLSDTWDITRPVNISGSGNTGSGNVLQFPAGKTGILFHQSAVINGVQQTTVNPAPADGLATTSRLSRISNLTLLGTDGGEPAFTATVDYSGVNTNGNGHFDGITFTAASPVSGGAATILNQAEFRHGQTFRIGNYSYIVNQFDDNVSLQKFVIKNPRFNGRIARSEPNKIYRNSYGAFDVNQWRGGKARIGVAVYDIASNDADSITLTANYNGFFAGNDSYNGDVEIVSLGATAVKIKQNIVHGVKIYATVTVENLRINGFSGNGVDIDSDYTPTGTNAADANGRNSNNSVVRSVASYHNKGHGFFLSGYNSNVILVESCDATDNHGYGFYTRNFHGATYVNDHAQANYQGGFGRGNIGLAAPSDVYLGTYTEGGDQPSSELSSALVIGGTQGAGFSANNGAALIQGQNGFLTTSPVLSQYYAPNFPASAYTIGGSPYTKGAIRELAGYGIAEDPYSIIKSGGRIGGVYPSITLAHGRIAPNWFTWAYGIEPIFAPKAASSVSDGNNADGGGWEAFSRGLLIGDIADGAKRLLTTANAPPEAERSQVNSIVTATGATLTRTGGGFFDPSGGWNGAAVVYIDSAPYVVQTVTDSTHLTLAKSTGITGKSVGADIRVPYQKGDRVLNNNPVSGGNSEWINTAGGVSGTWSKAGFIPMAGSGTLDFPAIPANSTAQITLVISNAAVGDLSNCNPEGSLESGLGWNSFISAPDTLTLRLINATTKVIDPVSKKWKCKAEKF